MQAGFPVAPQTLVALQPRQMIQPLPSGTERTLAAVPQFGLALANVLANDPPVDQTTVPVAEPATSGQDILAAMSVATANTTSSKPVPMPGLQAPPLDSPIPAAPVVRSASVAKSEVVNRPGSFPQAATEQCNSSAPRLPPFMLRISMLSPWRGVETGGARHVPGEHGVHRIGNAGLNLHRLRRRPHRRRLLRRYGRQHADDQEPGQRRGKDVFVLHCHPPRTPGITSRNPRYGP